MSIATACQTHGAIYSTKIRPQSVAIRVDLPEPLGLSGEEAEVLEANPHNALELVLARYFQAGQAR